MTEQEKKLKIEFITPSESCMEFIESGDGVFFAAESDFRNGHTGLKSETYSLAKWLKQNNSSIKVEVETCKNQFSLNSDEYWIPLIYMANNIAMPLFISALYDYLKWKIAGALSGEPNKVHLRIIRKKGRKYQEIHYEGPVEGLDKLKDL